MVCYDLGHFYFMAYVYKHIRKDTNEVFYIGIGKTKQKISSKRNRNIHWTRIVDRHGYEYEIIQDGLTWKQACEMETKLIKEYGRHDLNQGNLVNMTNGGDGTVGVIKVFSEEHKKNIQKSRIGKHHSEETKNKLRESLIGRKRPIFSDEHRQRLREANTGKTISEDTKNKIRESVKLTLHNKKQKL